MTDTNYLLLVGKVTHRFPAMVGARGARNKVDPYVVASAIHGSMNPHRRVVVCDETVNVRPNRKIPTACAAFGVECLSLFELLHREFPEDGW